MANTTVGASVQVEFASVGELRKALQDATKKADDLKKQFGETSLEFVNAQKEVAKLNNELSKIDIKGQLKAANQELIFTRDKFGETSKEAIAAAKRVAELKDQIQGAKETTDLFDPGNKFQAFTTAASQIAAGFSAVQGAMALVGAESEDVQKGLLKVQGALALTQGLSQLGDLEKSFTALNTIIAQSSILQKANAAATTLTSGAMRALGISVNTTSTSFKVLRTAIISTGIGALVVAIGFAVEALMNMADSSDEAAKAEKELEKQQKRTEDAIKLKNKALEDSIKFTNDYSQIQVKQAKLQGKSEEDIINIQRDALKKKIELRKQDVEDATKNNEINFEKTKAYGEALRELENFELDTQIKRQEENQRKQEELRRKGQETRTKKQEEDRKKREAADKVLDEARRAQLTEREREELDALTSFEENKKALQLAGITNFLDVEIAYQIQLEAIRKKYRDKEKQEADKEREEKLKKDKDAQEKDIANKQAQFEAIRQNTIEANSALVDAEVELQSAKFEAASAGLNAIATLAGENERLANVIFAIDKALAIAKIVVDTQREIAGYFATYSILGPAGVAAATKFTLGAKIRAATSIATIVATTIAKFKRGGGGASSGGGGGASVAGGGAAPVTALPSPTVTATAVNTQAVNALGNQSMRAYVLNSDITNNDQRNAYLERNARLG